MKSFKLILLSLFGLFLLNACDTEKDCPVNPLENGNQVKFQATIGAAGLRASGTSWDTGDAIGVYALNGGATLPSGVYDGKENIKYTTPGTGMFTAATTAISFPETGALDFVAYYPYQDVINDYTYNINVANQSNSAAIDLLYSNNAKGATMSNSAVSLEFKHILSLLVLNVAAGDGVASLDGLTVSIRDLKTDGTFNLANATITPGTTINTITASVSASGASGTVTAILVPGQNLDGATITFSLAGQVYEWTPEDMALESGKRYTYSIQLSTTGVVLLQPNATIIDWEDADTGTGSIILTPEEGTEDGYWTIAELRSKHTGSNVTITDDVKVKAVVVQNLAGGNSTSLKNIVVQDETAGIAIRFVDDNAVFDFGDEVEISIKDQQLSAYNGLLQINNLPNANVTKIGTKAVVAKDVTAAELLTGNYESQYLAVSNVQVVEADLSKTFATTAAHGSINMEAQSGETFVMFTSRFAAFQAETVPQGSGTLKGIASVNNTTYQILPTVAADYAGMTGARFGDPGGGTTGNSLFPGSDFENWSAFLASLNSFGLKDGYTSQSNNGRNGSKALYLNGTPTANDYVFTAVVPEGFSTAGKTKIVFYIKGTSAKSLSLNVYKSGGTTYNIFNLGSYSAEGILSSTSTNSYTGAINTSGNWMKVTLDISGLDINSTAEQSLFALKAGSNAAYDLLVDDITLE